MPTKKYSDGTTPQIAILGGGVSGMCIAIQLKRTLGLDSFTIYESGDDLGGTWLANKYPGCACDVPSHVYSFSFEPNPDWSEKFSQGPEILNYCRKVAKKYNLYQYTKLRTNVKSASWDKEAQLWRIKIQERDGDEREVSANIIVSGVGVLRTPAIPETFTNFKGPYIHSAQWDSEFDVEGKDVAIIGNGASAIQIIPEIVNKVKNLYVYQRTPTWIIPRNNYRYNGVVRWIFRYVPFVRRVYRWFLFLSLEMLFGITQPGTWISRMGARWGLLHLKNQVTDLNKRSLLTPHYAMGCKRVVVSDDYFPALNQPHVHIETSPITGIEGQSILTESNKQTVDAMILATGFRVQDFLAPLKVYGKEGNEISEVWQSAPKSYLGIMTAEFPNMFMLLGPNTGLGHNSVLFMIECQANYTVKMVSEMMKRNCRSAEVKKSAQEQFDSKVQKELSHSVWATGCRSWYKNSDGVITALWSGNCIDYWRATRSLKVSDIQFVK